MAASTPPGRGAWDFRVTLDLAELDGITEDGCQALRNFGAAVAQQRRKFRIVYPLGSEIAEALRETGALDDPQIEFGEGGTEELG